MSFYEQRITVDLEAIRDEVVDLGRTVESAIKSAVEATLTRDSSLAYQTILNDGPINRRTEDLTTKCHYFIAKHLPSAGHLRFISSAIRLGVLFERVGDYAVTICRESVQMGSPLTGTFRDTVEELAQDSLKMFDLALGAFHNQDSELASGTISFAHQVNRDFVSAYSTLAEVSEPNLTNADLFHRLVIISQLERVSDQAKNLCEETVFFLTGETKKRRRSQILFISRTDDSFTQMAVAIGRKYCSDRAEFDSLGVEPVPEVRADILEFMEDHGFGTDGLVPHTLDNPVTLWGDYNVIISIDQTWRSVIDAVPYGTIVQDWWIPVADPDGDQLQNAYRYLRDQIESLVTTLRGEARR